MALLLNRKYGSRLECLYYILKSRYNKFGKSNFRLQDLKFDENDENNVHQYCNMLKENLGIKYCPFLNSPLDDSKCYATQSKKSDSTKSKAVSDTGGSLEALGFIERLNNDNFKITNIGEEWCKTEFGTKQWEKIALEGVLSYGVVLGFLHKANQLPGDTFNYLDISIGYPGIEETAKWKGKTVTLSTDSKRDSETRARSRIISWLLSVGLLDTEKKVDNNNLYHLKYRDIVNAPRLSIRKYRKNDLFKKIMNKKIYVKNPLSYQRLNKNVGSLREHGSKMVREATLKYNDRILNRRYLIVFLLNKASKKEKNLNILNVIEEMKKYSEKFFIYPNLNNINEIILYESDIAFIVGLPYKVKDNSILIPQTKINEDVLSQGAPIEVKNIANKIWSNLE